MAELIMAKWKIWYHDKYTNELKTVIEETPETKEQLLNHAHVVKVELITNDKKEEIKEEVKKAPIKSKK